ncbi:RNA-binding protein, partial [Candidatus Bathyarchaeota archaeon]
QYLRKRLFKIRPELRYVGVLPPLRTPHHPTINRSEQLKIGEYREGIVISSSKKGSKIYIGVEKPAFVKGVKLPTGKRVTIKIKDLNREIEAVLANKEEIKEYWGYKVVISEKTLGKILKNWDLVIATSKYGVPFMNVKDELVQKWSKSKRRIILFGSPTAGLYEILKLEGLNLEEVTDFVVNTIPLQGVETVRTEEAVYASLAILNIFLSSGQV